MLLSNRIVMLEQKKNPSGLGKFIAVGYKGKICTSDDGENWDNIKIVATYNNLKDTLNCIAHGNGSIVAGGNGRALYSRNAVDWEVSDGMSGSFNGMTFAKNRFIGVTSQGAVYNSEDGKSWGTPVFITDTTSYPLTSILYIFGKFIALGSSCVYLSDDGYNWGSKITIKGMSNHFRCSSIFGDRCVIAGDGGCYAYSLSKSLSEWSTVKSLSNFGQFAKIVNVDDSLYACGYYGHITKWPSSGSGWEPFSSIPEQTGYWYGLCYSKNRFVLVGGGGKCCTSNDFENWSSANIIGGDTGYWKAVEYV